LTGSKISADVYHAFSDIILLIVVFIIPIRNVFNCKSFNRVYK